ncbi:MAG: peptidoglycan-associated lipoprotein Pal [Nitrospinales bacterium]
MRVSIKGSELYLVLAALIVVGFVGGCAKKQLPLNPPGVRAAGGGLAAAETIAPPQAAPEGGAASAPSAAAPAAKSETKEAATAGAEPEAPVMSMPFLPNITEETITEAESSFPSGSFRPGESYLSGGIPGAGGGSGAGTGGGPGGSFQPGESRLSGGGPGTSGGPGAGGSFGGSFQPGESYLSDGGPGAGGPTFRSGSSAGGPVFGSGSPAGGLGGLAKGSGGRSNLGSGRPGEFAGGGPTVGEGSRAGGLGGLAPGATQSGNLDIARMIPFGETADLIDVHFKFDQYNLDAHNKNILAKNARWLAAHPDVKIEIQGHCDERGTNNYNLGLGERRALSTKKYLMALGISQDRLFTISYGEERPFCTESNENCWWQNRRGHFLVSK